MIKVIIVEDDPMVAMINQQYIERFEEFQLIATVHSIGELWRVLETKAPDLILLDVYLPGETGIDFLLEIRKKELSIPIIMITAARDMSTIKKALEYGVIDFLIKPFTYERFQLAIEKFLQYDALTTSAELTDQETIDKLLVKKKEEVLKNERNRKIEPDLPKGLSRLTLKKILRAIDQQEESFSTEDIANEVNLSRISTKKYLQFLNELGYLKDELKYLTIGRPITVFHRDPEKESLIGTFRDTP